MTTMRDIAREAGVSYSTVSFVLNERAAAMGIREDTCQRVLEAASALGYRRNALARAMVTGESRVLGVIAHAMSGDVATRILAGVLEEANASQYLVKVMQSPWDVAPRDLLERCFEWRLPGLIAFDINENTMQLLHEEMRRSPIHVATVDKSLPQTIGISVISDDANGIVQALDHLQKLGHQRITFFAAAPHSSVAQRRAAFFEAEVRRRALPADNTAVQWSSWHEVEVMEDAARCILNQSRRPTAVICAGDAMSLILIREARARGLHVPHDLSVIGFGDSEMATYCDPPLTTIAQPFHEMGKTVTRHLIERIQAQSSTLKEPIDQLLPTHLQVRASTAIAVN